MSEAVGGVMEVGRIVEVDGVRNKWGGNQQ